MLLRNAVVILLFGSNLLQLAAAHDHVRVLLGFEVVNGLLQVVFLRMARCASECDYSFLWTLSHFEHCCLTFEEECGLIRDVIRRCWIIYGHSCASLLLYVLPLAWSKGAGMLQN